MYNLLLYVYTHISVNVNLNAHLNIIQYFRKRT